MNLKIKGVFRENKTQNDILLGSRTLLFSILKEKKNPSQNSLSNILDQIEKEQVRKKYKNKIIQIPLKIALFEWEIKRLKKSIKGLIDNSNKMPNNTPSDVCIDLYRYIDQHKESLRHLEKSVKDYYKKRDAIQNKGI